MPMEQLKKRLHESQPLFIGEDTAFRSAVLIPLVEIAGEWHVLFEVRSFKMRKQPGDISFPGGKIDPTDATPLEAALRETHEELGVKPQHISIIGKLSPYVASPSFVVYPFVGIINHDDVIPSYNKQEVEEVFTIPIKWLLSYEPYKHDVAIEPIPSPNFPYEKIFNGKKYQWRARAIEEWFYDYKQYTIWGLTARILKYFIQLMKKVNATS